MVGGLVKMVVKSGREHEFERLFGELNRATHEHERGCAAYTLMRSRLSPGVYLVHEQYADSRALAAHQTASYATRCYPQLRDLLERCEGEFFDFVAD
jgi:quinol monooxygenase YgiN